MFRTPDKWSEFFTKIGAVWQYRGGTAPHAVLTSGLHTSGVFNSGVVAMNPTLLAEAASDLVRLFVVQAPYSFSRTSVVLGAPTGATTLAHEVAVFVDRLRSRPCYTGTVLKADRDGREVFSLERILFDVQRQEIAVVEDTVTTGAGALKLFEAISDAGGEALSIVLALWNRSGSEEVGGRKIVALVNHPFDTWRPENCPLCAQGSEAFRPKGAHGWRRLMGDAVC